MHFTKDPSVMHCDRCVFEVTLSLVLSLSGWDEGSNLDRCFPGGRHALGLPGYCYPGDRFGGRTVRGAGDRQQRVPHQPRRVRREELRVQLTASALAPPPLSPFFSCVAVLALTCGGAILSGRLCSEARWSGCPCTE